MKLIVVLSLLSFTYLGAETRYYNSNKTGMLLNEISLSEAGDYYIKEERDEVNFYIKRTFNKEGKADKEIKSFYDGNFDKLLRIEESYDNEENISIFENNRLIKKEFIKDDKIVTYQEYFYTEEKLLRNIEYKNSENQLLYSDNYYRNSQGALRRVIRSSENVVSNYWYYKDGAILESWYIDGDNKTRTRFKSNGDIISSTGYINDDISFIKEYTYKDNNLKKTLRKSGNSSVEEIYNDLGLVAEKNILENELIIKKYIYTYDGENLVKEFIGGHGLTEEIFYTLDSEGTIEQTDYYVNSELRSRKISDGEDSETVEYFKKGKLYLKEYYIQKDRVKRERYIDGVLYKSENISE